MITELEILPIGRMLVRNPNYTFFKYKVTANTNNMTANKLYIPINYLGKSTPENVSKYREIVRYCRANYGTNSIFTSNDINGIKHTDGVWGTVPERNGVTLYFISNKAKFGIRLGTGVDNSDSIGGRDSAKVFMKLCDDKGIDLHKYITDDETPLKVPIDSHVYAQPLTEYKNVHHLDLNSAFLSGIITKYPELRPVCEEMYNNRHSSDKWKKIINSFIGALQSQWCPDIDDLRRNRPYSLKELSRAGRQYCYDKIQELKTKLIKSGNKIIETNTDGIWYQGELYTEGEGHNPCQFRNDHTNCTFLTSYNINYQFIEDNKVYTIARGTMKYERLVKEREEFEFGELIKAQEYDPREEEEIEITDKGDIIYV